MKRDKKDVLSDLSSLHTAIHEIGTELPKGAEQHVDMAMKYIERIEHFVRGYGLSVYDIGLGKEVHGVLTAMAASDKLPLDMTQLDILDVFSRAKESIEIRERKNHGNTSTEDVWAFEEGDEYFPIERMPEGGLHIARSVWDDISEELECIERFPTLREALNYIEAELPDRRATYSDYASPTTILIII